MLNISASHTHFYVKYGFVDRERIFLVEYVFCANGEYTDKVKREFLEKFPETDLPHWNTVPNLINKFRKHGSVKGAQRSGRPAI